MPQRAPNRDLVDRYDGRDALGTKRHYFRRWNRIEQWKWGLTGLALLVGVGWLAARPLGRLVGLSGGGAYRYSHGPLTSVHAAWDANCEACHKDTSGASLGSLFAVQNRWLDLTCEKCHAGPVHHESLQSVPRCASCHHDHRGRDASLVRIGDAHCTSCHANLSAHHKGGKAEYAETITDFAAHPEFRKLADGAKPTRTIKFSHALHVAAGVVTNADPKADRAALRLKDLKPDDAKRYRREGQTDDAFVQLDCASCHQLDAGRQGKDGTSPLAEALAGTPKESVQPPRAEGAYFLPVNFEAHCKACHPLDTAKLVAGNNVELPGFEVPHRKQPAELKNHLTGEYTRRLFAADPTLADRPAVPFARLNPAAKEPEVAKFRTEVETAVGKGMSKLFGQANPAAAGTSGSTCAKCHDLAGDGSRVEPVRIPTVWFEHAKFSHVAHRGAACAECHPTTTPKPDAAGKIAVNEREPVNILGVASCRQCHAPARAGVGGVRHGCADCHRYHNGDHPFQGRGAPARDPAAPLTVGEFLLGGTAAKDR